MIKRTTLDLVLEEKNLIRKHVGKDRSSLFRCFAERVKNSQLLHTEVKMEFQNYVREHYSGFKFNQVTDENYVPQKDDVQTLCSMYNLTAVIYGEVSLDSETNMAVGENFRDEKLILLAYDEGRKIFDLVYPKKYMQMLQMVQSSLYRMFYCLQTGTSEYEVDDMVHKMISDRYYSKKKLQIMNRKKKGEDVTAEVVDGPPISYALAKCLSPNYYRNLAFDSWVENNREVYQGFLASQRICPGVKGKIKSEDEVGWVQEVIRDKNEAIVFSLKAGEKKTVPLNDVKEIKAKGHNRHGNKRYSVQRKCTSGGNGSNGTSNPESYLESVHGFPNASGHYVEPNLTQFTPHSLDAFPSYSLTPPPSIPSPSGSFCLCTGCVDQLVQLDQCQRAAQLEMDRRAFHQEQLNNFMYTQVYYHSSYATPRNFNNHGN